DSLLQSVHEIVDAVEQREVRVDRAVGDGVHQPLRTALEQLRVALDTLDDVADRQRLPAVHRYEIVRPKKEVEIEGLEIVRVVGLLEEAHTADDHEQVARILLELDATVRIERILNGERVKA